MGNFVKGLSRHSQSRQHFGGLKNRYWVFERVAVAAVWSLETTSASKEKKIGNFDFIHLFLYSVVRVVHFINS